MDINEEEELKKELEVKLRKMLKEECLRGFCMGSFITGLLSIILMFIFTAILESL